MRDFKKGSAGELVLPNNIQCIYTFIAKPNQRVKLEFTHFQLAGTSTNCDMEYVDIYSELETPSDDLLVASLGGRYCGTAAPRVRISLYNVMVLVFHSRVGIRRSDKFVLDGHYHYIPETRYVPGRRLPGSTPEAVGKCAFLIESSKRKQGTILSPTYPGTYPNNFYCAYLLKGEPTERIRLYMRSTTVDSNSVEFAHLACFRDFDIYFAGEHCPYDALTVYDGYSNTDHIIKKICGLQQRMEIFSFSEQLLIEFNTTDPAKGDPRGFAIEYEFSAQFVDLRHVIGNQKGISHIRGTECDFRVRSNRESVHYIESPSFPNVYPPNTTCTYILDGLQGDQDLEKVILEFEEVALIASNDADAAPKSASSRMTTSESTDECAGSFIGVATTSTSIKAVLANNEESVYDATLCNRVAKGSPRLGPYSSQGPRLVVVFGSSEASTGTAEGVHATVGFRARVEFKTDFGVPGVPMGDSSKCQFLFQSRRGSFNSPRFPANYPLDSNCTYHIRGKKGDQILLYFQAMLRYSVCGDDLLLRMDSFQQFALFEENSRDVCSDYVEVFDVLHDATGREHLVLQAKHCWTMFPGPTISTFGAHEMRVVFSSDSFGTANGFNAVYEIRKAFKEDVPTAEHSDRGHCGHVITVVDGRTSGYFTSPGFPVKYSKDQICDWEIRARPRHQILLQLVKMDVEGEMTDIKTSCGAAVIRVHLNDNNHSSDVQICGTNPKVIAPIISLNDSIRISFLTAPEKVNGLQGFNFTWTEVRSVDSDNQCADRDQYLCSYTRLCIASSLRCNGDENCGENDDTDEAHCNIAEKASDSRTIMIAATFSGFIFLFIFAFFCILFKAKLERKQDKEKRKKRDSSKRSAKTDGKEARRLRQPYRPAKKLEKPPQRVISRSVTMMETRPPQNYKGSKVVIDVHGKDDRATGMTQELSPLSMISPGADGANVQIFYG